MNLKDSVILFLLAALAVASGLAWGWQKDAALADARVSAAEQARDLAIDANNRALDALQRCEAEMARVRDENARALREARQATAQAEHEAEAFRARLKAAPAGCDALLHAPVCPALRGY